jgi:hypothetical protein
MNVYLCVFVSAAESGSDDLVMYLYLRSYRFRKCFVVLRVQLILKKKMFNYFAV